jgi:hypothetical protein
MNGTQNQTSGRLASSIILIRLAVGLIFFTQGILKFTDPKMGVVRFTKFNLI